MILENTKLGSTDLLASGRARLHSIHHLSLASLSQLLTTRFGSVTILIAILAIQYDRSPRRRVPPGSTGLPILGNALQLMDKSWMFERACKRNFEHMMYSNALGQPIIVLNSLKAAFELLDQCTHISSDHPRLIISNEILCSALFTAFLSYGNIWRRNPRAAHEMLTKVAVCNYHPVLCKKAVYLASAILKNPDSLDKQFQRPAADANLRIK